MRRWTITATVEAENDYDAVKIAHQIARDCNRGDGIYIVLHPVAGKIMPKLRKKKP